MAASRNRSPNRGRSSAGRHNGGKKRWSKRVTETSHALDLDRGTFSKRSPRQVALALKRSAERSRHRKADPYRSAMSMLNFYINRAGTKLAPERKRVLEKAKVELRNAFGR